MTSQTFDILVTGDTDVELNEDFSVHLSKTDNAKLGAAYFAESMIVNDDGPPAVSLYPLDSWKDEGNTGATTPFTFRIVRSGDPDADFSVEWKVDPALGDADIDDFGGAWPRSSAPVIFDDPSKMFEDIAVGVSGDTEYEPTATSASRRRAARRGCPPSTAPPRRP